MTKKSEVFWTWARKNNSWLVGLTSHGKYKRKKFAVMDKSTDDADVYKVIIERVKG